jgi:hypothetical protein
VGVYETESRKNPSRESKERRDGKKWKRRRVPTGDARGESTGESTRVSCGGKGSPEKGKQEEAEKVPPKTREKEREMEKAKTGPSRTNEIKSGEEAEEDGWNPGENPPRVKRERPSQRRRVKLEGREKEAHTRVTSSP